MKIIACVRQTPDTESVVKIGGDGKSILTDGVKYIIGPYDEYALEAAVQIKEKEGGEVTALSLGPARVTEALRSALAKGADKAVHIDTGSADIDDALVVASALATQIKAQGDIDLVFTAARGTDSDRGAVGPILADLLGLPYVGLVTDIEVAGGKITCKRDVEGGATETFSVTTPAVVCGDKGIRGEPRYPALMAIMKAKKKPITTVSFDSLGIDSGLAQVELIGYEAPPERPPGRIIEGASIDAKIDELVRLLKDEAKVV